MLFIAAFALLAHDVAAPADRAAPEALAVFPTVSPSNAVPPLDAVIPTNAHVFAFVNNAPDDSANIDETTFTRFLSDGSSSELSAREISGLGTAFDVDLGALTTGESVIVQATCNTCQGQFSFTVGAGDDLTPPAFDEGRASRFQVQPQQSGDLIKNVTGYFVNGCLPAVHDDSGVALRVTLDEGPGGLFPVSGTSACGTSLAFTIPGGEERDVCMSVVAVDVAGNETALPDDICLTLTHDGELGGCAQTSASTSWPLALLALSLSLAMRIRSRA